MRNTMMRYIIITLILLINTSNAQSVSALFGYTEMNLSSQKGLFSNLRKNWPMSECNIPVQENFPANVYFSGGFDLITSPKYSLGIELIHLRTNAYALYGDAVGDIDLKSTFYSTLAGVRADRFFIISDGLKAAIGGTAGLGAYSFTVDGMIRLKDYPAQESRSSNSEKGTIIFCDLHGRLEQQVYQQVWAAVEIGYRFGARLTGNFLKTDDSNNDMEYNINGARAAVALKYYLPTLF